MLNCNQLYIYLFPSSYVVHAEVNAILNTNHASAAGQVWLFQSPIPLYIPFNFYKNFTGFLCLYYRYKHHAGESSVKHFSNVTNLKCVHKLFCVLHIQLASCTQGIPVVPNYCLVLHTTICALVISKSQFYV